MELVVPNRLRIIVEAKRGWGLPTAGQLRKYATRLRVGSEKAKRLVTLSECSVAFARDRLPSAKSLGVSTSHVPLRDLIQKVARAMTTAARGERFVLRDALLFLKKIVNMQQHDTNWVYVVSIGGEKRRGWRIALREIVEKRRKYFHPVGGRYPHEPVTYIAFRYDGRLQSVHHVDRYLVFSDPHEVIPEIPSQSWGPMYLYSLGPAIRPSAVVRTGKIFRNGRVWCTLDTLLTCKTIASARDVSQARERKALSAYK